MPTSFGEHMGCLYKLTSPNGKAYIGISSKGVADRWAKHIEHAHGRRSGALYAAIRKYGASAFSVSVLATCDVWSELCQLEVAAITEHGTMVPRGYNLTVGGEGVLGPRTDEARRNISIAQKKRFQRPEERERMKAYSRMAAASPKRRAAYDAKRKPKMHKVLLTPEERSARIRAGMATPAGKAAMSMGARARAASPEWRAKISSSKRGVKIGPCSPERKRKISEARKREWADPVIRERRLVALARARAAKESHGQIA